MLGWSITASAWRSCSNRASTALESMPALMSLSATWRLTGSDLLGDPNFAHAAFADLLGERVAPRDDLPGGACSRLRLGGRPRRNGVGFRDRLRLGRDEVDGVRRPAGARRWPAPHHPRSAGEWSGPRRLTPVGARWSRSGWAVRRWPADPTTHPPPRAPPTGPPRRHGVPVGRRTPGRETRPARPRVSRGLRGTGFLRSWSFPGGMEVLPPAMRRKYAGGIKNDTAFLPPLDQFPIGPAQADNPPVARPSLVIARRRCYFISKSLHWMRFLPDCGFGRGSG